MALSFQSLKSNFQCQNIATVLQWLESFDGQYFLRNSSYFSEIHEHDLFVLNRAQGAGAESRIPLQLNIQWQKQYKKD